ncbi:hypothetical protein [Glacieibacterium frigidum]|uniref:Uncharacterized protein n=1 Tax=Glacieibacterium frigidum TaxID=2593303 RepID=A0A552UGT0_9SPHN|nr:hypothetical protein [Glacieibacterium frigidum]TRW17420.1 hypothetical protein FMM06_04445 [Glacieibacterium frigidum]
MASPPKFTENADAPLSVEELAGDRAASGQTTDPLDAPLGDDEERTHDDPDGTADLEEREDTVVQNSLTMLPPG